MHRKSASLMALGSIVAAMAASAGRPMAGPLADLDIGPLDRRYLITSARPMRTNRSKGAQHSPGTVAKRAAKRRRWSGRAGR